MLTPWKESYDQPRQHIKKQRHDLANKGPSSQGYGFSCGHVWMWELDCEVSWAPKNWCFWTVVLEKTLESPLDCKEIQPWDFFGRNDAKAETPVLWPPHVKSWLTGKDSNAGRDWGQEEKGMTEDEMAGWHHGLDGRESEWTPGDGDGQGGLACCDSWGRKESDTTDWLNCNWTDPSNIESLFAFVFKLVAYIFQSLLSKTVTSELWNIIDPIPIQLESRQYWTELSSLAHW